MRLHAAEVHVRTCLTQLSVVGRDKESSLERQTDTVGNNDSLRQKEQTGGPQAGFVGLHNVLKITEPTF